MRLNTSEVILLAWSGGKDSTLALAELRRSPEYQVAGLITTVTSVYDRVSIHGTRRSILEAQAGALGLPVFEATLPPDAGNAVYEAAWARAIRAAEDAVGPVRGIAYGDLFLEDVRRFREDLARRAGYHPLFPIWGWDTRDLAHSFVREGYEAYVTCVDTTQLDARFAGRRYDRSFLDELPTSVDPAGERGEFHTCVVAGPGFRHPIRVQVGERVRRDERFEFCDLLPS